jgi:hypothetical protein
MTAATVVLEAIFEADMPAEQHGYSHGFVVLSEAANFF